MIRDGQLVPEFLKDNVLQNPGDKNEPPGTRSQAIRYRDAQGRFCVTVHQYLRPDGTLGGRGRRPDPKRLRIGDITYYTD